MRKQLFILFIFFTTLAGAQNVVLEDFYFTQPFQRDTSGHHYKEIYYIYLLKGKNSITSRKHINRFGFIDTVEFFKGSKLEYNICFKYIKDTIPDYYIEGFFSKQEINDLLEYIPYDKRKYLKGNSLFIKNKYLIADSNFSVVRSCNGRIIDTIRYPKLKKSAPSISSYHIDTSLKFLINTIEEGNYFKTVRYFSIDSILLFDLEYNKDSIGFNLIRSAFYTYNEKQKIKKIIYTNRNQEFMLARDYYYKQYGDTLIIKIIENGINRSDSNEKIYYYNNNKLFKMESNYIDVYGDFYFETLLYNAKGELIQRRKKRNGMLIEDMILEYLEY